MGPAQRKEENSEEEKMRRLALGIDVNETIDNMIAKLLDAYNDKYFDNVKYEDITSYDIQPFLRQECTDPFREFCSYSFMTDLDIVDGAVEALTELHQRHDIYFVTAGFSYMMAPMDAWLHAKFPFYQPEMLIGCVNKQLLKLDMLIDDCPDNLVGGDYVGLLVNKPWNRSFDNRAYQTSTGLTPSQNS